MKKSVIFIDGSELKVTFPVFEMAGKVLNIVQMLSNF